MTSYGESKTKKECIANSTLVSLFAKRFPAGRWSFLVPGSETKWFSTYNEKPQGEWDRVAELMMMTFRESGHEPIVSKKAQKQRRWKFINTFLCRWRSD